MSVGAIGSLTPSYTPQKVGGQDNTAQLENKLEALNKQLREIKQNDKIDPEKKKKQIENIEKQIAEIEKRIAQMKSKSKDNEGKGIEHVQEGDLPQKPSTNHIIDEYA